MLSDLLVARDSGVGSTRGLGSAPGTLRRGAKGLAVDRCTRLGAPASSPVWADVGHEDLGRPALALRAGSSPARPPVAIRTFARSQSSSSVRVAVTVSRGTVLVAPSPSDVSYHPAIGAARRVPRGTSPAHPSPVASHTSTPSTPRTRPATAVSTPRLHRSLPNNSVMRPASSGPRVQQLRPTRRAALLSANATMRPSATLRHSGATSGRALQARPAGTHGLPRIVPTSPPPGTQDSTHDRCRP